MATFLSLAKSNLTTTARKALAGSTRTSKNVAQATMTTSSVLMQENAPSAAAVGVARALQDQSETSSPTIFTNEFALTDRVALVTGANRSLGLETALALIEAGARAVYCVDIAKTPGAEWQKVREYVSRMTGKPGEGRLEYIHADVRKQEEIWKVGETIGDREGRLDICFAIAGILGESVRDCLRLRDAQLQTVLDVNLKGMLFTAQAAGQQMERFGSPGSIVLFSSVAGHISANMGILAYEVSKSGVHAMGRSLACSLAPKGIRVNTISPTYMNTAMVQTVTNAKPGLKEAMAKSIPMQRIGEPHELRGAVVWLASDASSFCTGGDVLVSGGQTAC